MGKLLQRKTVLALGVLFIVGIVTVTGVGIADAQANNHIDIYADEFTIRSTGQSVRYVEAEHSPSLTVSVILQNVGTPYTVTGIVNFTTTLYRSTDTTITKSDTVINTATNHDLAFLVDSRFKRVDYAHTFAVPASIGAYYYGVCFNNDPSTPSNHVLYDNNPSNDCSPAFSVFKGDSPDLDMLDFELNKSSANASEVVSGTGTIKNLWVGETTSYRISAYRSDDSTITTSDTLVATKVIQGTVPARGRSVNQSLDIAAHTSGTKYYGMCVSVVGLASGDDSELNLSNNCSVGRSLKINIPDIRIENQRMSPTIVKKSGAATFTATAYNRGTGASGSFTVTYYRSVNRSITSADTSLGSETINSIGAGGGIHISKSITAPGTKGNYYYGACATNVTGETSVSNNCSTGVLLTVAVPDIRMDTPTRSKSVVSLSESFDFSVTANNIGGVSSGAFTITYYRSTNDSITSQDASLGTVNATSLNAGKKKKYTMSFNAPATKGAYYYGACATGVTNEETVTNNCSSGVLVTVSLPDVRLDSPTVSSSVVDINESFDFSVTANNVGGVPSGSFTLTYYRSDNDTITATDANLGTASIDSLNAGSTEVQSMSVSAPATKGSYYYGACVSGVVNEEVVNNNCSSGVLVTVTAEPDIIIESPALTPSTVNINNRFVFSASVKNQGNLLSGSFIIHYYTSDDSTISATDTRLSSASVSSIEPDASSNVTYAGTAPATRGSYYYGACVTGVSGEVATANNCSTGVLLSVVAAPDIYLDSISVDPSTVSYGDRSTLSVTARNSGNLASGAFTVTYYRSATSTMTVTTGRTRVGSENLSTINPNGLTDLTFAFNAPSTGDSYYYGACASGVTNEVNTDNNCSDGVRLTLRKSPDLILGLPTISATSTVVDRLFSFRVDVTNQGAATSSAATIKYYRSLNSEITETDTLVRTGSVISIGPGDTTNVHEALRSASTATNYYYGACVSNVEHEVETTNNCSDGVLQSIEGSPNVSISDIAIDPAQVMPGDDFTITVTISNTGTGQSARGAILFYRSADQTITAGDIRLSHSSLEAIASGSSVEKTADLTASNTQSTYYYGACMVLSGSITCSSAVTLVVTNTPGPPPEPPTVTPLPPPIVISTTTTDYNTIYLTATDGGFFTDETPDPISYYFDDGDVTNEVIIVVTWKAVQHTMFYEYEVDSRDIFKVNGLVTQQRFSRILLPNKNFDSFSLRVRGIIENDTDGNLNILVGDRTNVIVPSGITAYTPWSDSRDIEYQAGGLRVTDFVDEEPPASDLRTPGEPIPAVEDTARRISEYFGKDYETSDYLIHLLILFLAVVPAIAVLWYFGADGIGSLFLASGVFCLTWVGLGLAWGGIAPATLAAVPIVVIILGFISLKGKGVF